MYALVKVLDKYDVIQKRHINKKSERISSKFCNKPKNVDRFLIACSSK